MALFTELAQALTTKGTRIHAELVALGDGQFQARLTPDLGPCPDNASAEEVNLRSLLGSPLTITGTAEEMDAALSARIAERMVTQNMGMSALNDLHARMSKASEAAAKAKPKAGSAKAAKASTATSGEQSQADASTGAEKVTRNDTSPESPMDWATF